MLIKGFSTLILIEGNQGASLPRNQSYDDQRASLPQSWWKVTKGILYLRIEAVEMSIKGLLYFDLNCWNVDQRASLLWSEFFECRSKGFSTLIWIVEMLIKGLLYFDLSCWNVDQRASLLWSELLECLSNGFSSLILLWKCRSKGFSTLISLLKCRSKGFSTLIWIVTCKKSKFEDRL